VALSAKGQEVVTIKSREFAQMIRVYSQHFGTGRLHHLIEELEALSASLVAINESDES
jgi:hypothetical protein